MKKLLAFTLVLMMLGMFSPDAPARTKHRHVRAKMVYHIMRNLNSRTAEGKRLRDIRMRIGASNHLPLGTKVKVPGFGIHTCADRMNRAHRKKSQTYFELYFYPSEKEKIRLFEAKYNNKIINLTIYR